MSSAKPLLSPVESADSPVRALLAHQRRRRSSTSRAATPSTIATAAPSPAGFKSARYNKAANRRSKAIWGLAVSLLILAGIAVALIVIHRENEQNDDGPDHPSGSDVPFDQPVARRKMTYKDVGKVSDWPVLPISVVDEGGVVDVQTAHDDPGGALLLTQRCLYYLDRHDQLVNLSALLPPDMEHAFESGTRVVSTRTRLTAADGLNLDARQQVRFAIVSPDAMYRCAFAPRVNATAPASCVCQNVGVNAVWSAVTAVVSNPNGDVYIGAEEGLFFVAGTTTYSLNVTAVEGPVVALAWDVHRDVLAVATPTQIYRSMLDMSAVNAQREFRSWWNVGLIDAPPTDMSFDNDGALWIVNDVCVNVQHANLTFHRLSFDSGLPVRNLTSVSARPWLTPLTRNPVWMGSKTGAIRYAPRSLSLYDTDTAWRYFNGPRWLPSLADDLSPVNSVRSVAVLESVPDNTATVLSTFESVLIATDTGLSRIDFTVWTLEDKAQHLQDMVSPRHLRYGLISDARLSTFGDVSSSTPIDGDMDGAHTAEYLLSQAYRFAATKSTDARDNALQAFEALEFLHQVTGIDGLMARTVVRASDSRSPDGMWYNSTTKPGWMWRGDASSAVVVGHLQAYPVFIDLVAPHVARTYGDRARAIFVNTTRYIVQNDFYLVGKSGKPTTLGVWDPTLLNTAEWTQWRGPNSAQMLAFLVTALDYSVGVDTAAVEVFNNAMDTLTTAAAHFDENLYNAMLTEPSQVSFEQQAATWPAYWIHAVSKSTRFVDAFRAAWERTRHTGLVYRQRNPLFLIMYAVATDHSGFSDDDLQQALWTLRTMPISLVNWPFENRQRIDYQINVDFRAAPAHGAEGPHQALDVYPYDEISMSRWTSSPFLLDGAVNQNDGKLESDPTSFLLPYWMARYYGYIS